MSTADTLVSCRKCGHSFRLHETKPRIMANQAKAQEIKRARQCGHCGRYCCVSCQPSDQPCSCGQRIWRKVYFEVVHHSWWQRILGR